MQAGLWTFLFGSIAFTHTNHTTASLLLAFDGGLLGWIIGHIVGEAGKKRGALLAERDFLKIEQALLAEHEQKENS